MNVVGQNITANESINDTLSNYLQEADGQFHNPYNNEFLTIDQTL